ncbi:MAG: hypothetical protein HYT73_02600 [Candidatus Aenigmarchaeota archaeon]|nr:hypothetical protein [Candidatus Aenigmarchaeota archaeon]
MKNELLTIFDDSDSLAILIALYHWNPRTLEQVSNDVSISQDIVKKKLSVLTNIGFVETTYSKYEISSFGKVYIESMGISKEIIERQINENLKKC